jgi:hypothetical protein
MAAGVFAVNHLMKGRAGRARLLVLVPPVLAEGDLLGAALRQLPDDATAQPEQMKAIIIPWLSRFLQAPPQPGDQWGGNFVLGTKFLHWASSGRTPVWDSVVRNVVVHLQHQWRNLNPQEVNEDVMVPGEGWQVDPIRTYGRWIDFCSALVLGLQARQPGILESLRNLDLESQATHHPEWAVRNTIIRVLDKYFWMKGQHRNHAPAAP